MLDELEFLPSLYVISGAYDANRVTRRVCSKVGGAEVE